MSLKEQIRKRIKEIDKFSKTQPITISFYKKFYNLQKFCCLRTENIDSKNFFISFGNSLVSLMIVALFIIL